MSNDEELNTSLCINYDEINNDNISKNDNDNRDNSVNKQVSFDNDNESFLNEKNTDNNLPDNLKSKKNR